MAKPATLQIKLLSTADTGFFMLLKKILELSQKNWN